METIASIIFSLVVGLFVYLFFVITLKREKARQFFKDQWWLHPNSICLWRVIMGIAGTLLYFLADYHFIGILFFTVSAILDGVDGLIARACDLATESGEEIDPLCDKVTYLPPMVFFAYGGLLDITAIWVLIVIEFCGQFLVRAIIKRFTSFSVGANNFGKIKAVLCFALIIYCALLNGALDLPNFTKQVLYACIILSIASSVFKLIPNRFYADILSILNLLCGLGGIIMIFQGRYVLAVIAILAGQFFDLFDGRMAEKHGGTKLGPWLDDIADLVSFGFCPGIMILVQGELRFPALFIGIFYSIAVAFRLWRFLRKDKYNNTLPKGVFNGLPSPAGALLALGTSLFWQDDWISWVVILLTCFLLISHIRFIHFRLIIFRRLPRAVVILIGFAVAFVIAYLINARDSQLLGATLLICFFLYIAICNHRVLGKYVV